MYRKTYYFSLFTFTFSVTTVAFTLSEGAAVTAVAFTLSKGAAVTAVAFTLFEGAAVTAVVFTLFEGAAVIAAVLILLLIFQSDVSDYPDYTPISKLTRYFCAAKLHYNYKYPCVRLKCF